MPTFVQSNRWETFAKGVENCGDEKKTPPLFLGSTLVLADPLWRVHVLRTGTNGGKPSGRTQTVVRPMQLAGSLNRARSSFPNSFGTTADNGR